MRRPGLVVIGASAGGVEAITELLTLLDAPFPVPILVVQHLPSQSSANVRLIFGRHTKNDIFEVEDKVTPSAGSVYFAPAGYHVLIERSRSFALSQDEPVNFSRPSIDVTFDSAAEVFQEELIGVLLTGANEDGAEGMKLIQAAGGTTLVQDPKTASIDAMPLGALRRMTPDFVLPLKEIAQTLNRLAKGGVQ